MPRHHHLLIAAAHHLRHVIELYDGPGYLIIRSVAHDPRSVWSQVRTFGVTIRPDQRYASVQ